MDCRNPHSNSNIQTYTRTNDERQAREGVSAGPDAPRTRLSGPSIVVSFGLRARRTDTKVDERHPACKLILAPDFAEVAYCMV